MERSGGGYRFQSVEDDKLYLSIASTDNHAPVTVKVPGHPGLVESRYEYAYNGLPLADFKFPRTIARWTLLSEERRMVARFTPGLLTGAPSKHGNFVCGMGCYSEQNQLVERMPAYDSDAEGNIKGQGQLLEDLRKELTGIRAEIKGIQQTLVQHGETVRRLQEGQVADVLGSTFTEAR
ncbi:hypothetical protein B0J17DRAFT_643250 [Rhizoctonia solani]|nr:hypothetical protein B0J17DRAFT_643250 [Rhizoctonia solani]